MEELYNSLGNNQIIFDSQFVVGVDLRTYIRAENFQGFKKEKSIIYQIQNRLLFQTVKLSNQKLLL